MRICTVVVIGLKRECEYVQNVEAGSIVLGYLSDAQSMNGTIHVHRFKKLDKIQLTNTDVQRILQKEKKIRHHVPACHENVENCTVCAWV